MSGGKLTSEIIYCGLPAVVACDGKCDKAFGIDHRPISPNLEADDFEWLADDELPEAPAISDTTEGGHNTHKPIISGASGNASVALCLTQPRQSSCPILANADKTPQ